MMSDVRKALEKYGINERMYKDIRAIRPNIHTLQPTKVIRNTTTMEKYLTENEIKSRIYRYPKVLESDIDTWDVFLYSYGVSKKDIRNILLNSYDVISETNIYNFGIRIMKLKSYGFTDEEILRLYIPYFWKK